MKLPPVIQLRPYQQRWVLDGTRFKGAVKSARIGFSFGTGVEALLDCIEHADGGITWTVLSASRAQSNEFVEQAQKNLQAIGAVGQLFEEPYSDIEGLSSITQSRIQIGDSRLIALPANPRTARGYPGNAILDEFGHHEDSYSIWAAVTRQVALGHKLRVLSTPNGQQGKFFDLAREFGLHEGIAPETNPVRIGAWSWHWIDVHTAVHEGCPINVNEMRDLIKDEDTFRQEFLCIFLAATGAWVPLELIAQCEDEGATVDWPAGHIARCPLYAGIDVGRERDLTIMWLDEVVGDVAWTRMVKPLHSMPFPNQQRELEPWVKLCTRAAIDSTGMGIALYDYLNERCGGRVMGINFAGSNDGGVKMKTDLAIRLKRNFEKSRNRIPYDPDVRAELQAVRREATASGVKFDAPRVAVDSAIAGGARRKVYSHADRFWAKALADLAAETASHISTDHIASKASQAHAMTGAYLG